MIATETIDKIYQAADIEEVIGGFVALKKFGANYKALSPFSQEKTPSFVVSPSKQIFKDFSSGKGGNVVTFLMEHEQFSYPEALRFLAQKYGIEIKETELTPAQKEKNSRRETLFIIHKVLADFLIDRLNREENFWQKYLRERKISPQIAEQFELGCAGSSYSEYSEYLQIQGYSSQDLVEAGVSSTSSEAGKLWDRFRGRLMFPIHNITGRVLGFGGRCVPNMDRKMAKYINSPDTDLYDKSSVLYGLYQAKKDIAIRETCVLVEGYMDVLALHQVGVTHAVACSGTSLSPNHVRLIRRFCKHIVLCYDADEAGTKATFRAINIVLEQQLQVSVLRLPSGQDPHDFATQGSEDVRAYFDLKPVDFLEFMVKYHRQKYGTDPNAISKSVSEVVDSIALISDAVKQELYLKSCAQWFDMDVGLIRQSLHHKASQKSQEVRHTHTEKKAAVRPLEKPLVDIESQQRSEDIHVKERELLRLMILYGNTEIQLPMVSEAGLILEDTYRTTVVEEIVAHLQQDQLQFNTPLIQTILEEVVAFLKQDRLPEDRFFLQHSEQEISKLSSDLVTERYALEDWHKIDVRIPEVDVAQNMGDTLMRWKETLLTQQLAEHVAHLETSEASQMDEIYRTIEEKTRIRREIRKRIKYSF